MIVPTVTVAMAANSKVKPAYPHIPKMEKPFLRIIWSKYASMPIMPTFRNTIQIKANVHQSELHINTLSDDSVIQPWTTIPSGTGFAFSLASPPGKETQVKQNHRKLLPAWVVLLSRRLDKVAPLVKPVSCQTLKNESAMQFLCIKAPCTVV